LSSFKRYVSTRTLCAPTSRGVFLHLDPDGAPRNITRLGIVFDGLSALGSEAVENSNGWTFDPKELRTAIESAGPNAKPALFSVAAVNKVELLDDSIPKAELGETATVSLPDIQLAGAELAPTVAELAGFLVRSATKPDTSKLRQEESHGCGAHKKVLGTHTTFAARELDAAAQNAVLPEWHSKQRCSSTGWYVATRSSSFLSNDKRRLTTSPFSVSVSICSEEGERPKSWVARFRDGYNRVGCTANGDLEATAIISRRPSGVSDLIGGESVDQWEAVVLRALECVDLETVHLMWEPQQ